MSLKKIKLDFFYIRKSFFQYKKGWHYIYYRYFFAPKILKVNFRLDKPINQDDLSIHILTCHRDLVISIWSLFSFYKNSHISGKLYIHSDGSLSEKDKELLLKFFPDSSIIESKTFISKYNEDLNIHPILKYFRSKYDNFSFKKIIDPYFVSDRKYQLLLDSDVLWFNKASEIIDTMVNKKENCFMQDNRIVTNFIFKDGSSPSDELASFNAGIVFWNKDSFNLNKLADFLNTIDVGNSRNLHFADQLGYAYCLENLKKLPIKKYQIKSTESDEIIAKHYTSPRRPLFYIEGIVQLKNLIL